VYFKSGAIKIIRAESKDHVRSMYSKIGRGKTLRSIFTMGRR
jgi:hypothetical protein